MTKATAEALALVSRERERQDRLHAEGRITYDCAGPGVTDWLKLPVLTEELGEVAKVLNEGLGTDELRHELVQVAAVAVAWLEALARPPALPR